jgi:hypothetical protein
MPYANGKQIKVYIAFHSAPFSFGTVSSGTLKPTDPAGGKQWRPGGG